MYALMVSSDCTLSSWLHPGLCNVQRNKYGHCTQPYVNLTDNDRFYQQGLEQKTSENVFSLAFR